MKKDQYSLFAVLTAVTLAAISIWLVTAGLLGTILVTAGFAAVFSLTLFLFESTSSPKSISSDPVSLMLLTFLLFVVVYGFILVAGKIAHS